MSKPDLTIEQALEIERNRPIGRTLLIAAAFVLVLGGVTYWASRLLRPHFGPVPGPVGAVVFGTAYAGLAIIKPPAYWNSASAVRARLQNSAAAITAMTMIPALGFIAMGLYGIFH